MDKLEKEVARKIVEVLLGDGFDEYEVALRILLIEEIQEGLILLKKSTPESLP